MGLRDREARYAAAEADLHLIIISARIRPRRTVAQPMSTLGEKLPLG